MIKPIIKQIVDYLENNPNVKLWNYFLGNGSFSAELCDLQIKIQAESLSYIRILTLEGKPIDINFLERLYLWDTIRLIRKQWVEIRSFNIYKKYDH